MTPRSSRYRPAGQAAFGYCDASRPPGAAGRRTGDPAWDSPVIARARQAHRAVLEAAARHAAATAAMRMVDDEVRATRYRLRAVQDRWIPRLEQALAETTFTIEELARRRRQAPSGRRHSPV